VYKGVWTQDENVLELSIDKKGYVEGTLNEFTVTGYIHRDKYIGLVFYLKGAEDLDDPDKDLEDTSDEEENPNLCRVVFTVK
jgi:hypothetical protein